MRILLVFFLMLPLFAQQPPAEAKPEAQAAAPAKPEEAKPAAADEKAASPVPSTESGINGYVDFGYRWVGDVKGNFQQYRSVVNLGQGPQLFGFDLTLKANKLYDTLTLRGAGFGNEPYNTAHIDLRKAKRYDLRFDYRNIAYFNAIPSFGNASAPNGFNEHSFDIRRRDASFELDLFPGSRIIPYLAYDRDSSGGRGVETWVLGSTNDFPVPYTVRNHANRLRGGLRFEFNRFHMTVEQGGNRYREDDNSLWTGSNLGDRTTPVSGELTRLTSLNQAYGIRGQGVFSRVLMTARPSDWFHLHGQFLYSRPKTTVSYSEIVTGNLFDFSTQAFFPGQYLMTGGNAVQPFTSGNGGFEMNLGRIRILETLSYDHFRDTGYANYRPQTFASFLTAPATSADAGQEVTTKQAQTDVLVDVGRGLTLRAGHRYMRGDATLRAGNLSQTGPSDTGELHRTVGLFGFTYRPWKRLSFNGDYEASSSDRVYFRASLNEYHRARISAKLQVTQSLLIQAKFRVMENQNPATDIRLDYESRDNSVSAFWTPGGGKRVSFTAQYDRSTVNSDIRYLDLPFLVPATSSYRDIAHQATSAMDIMLPGIKGGKLTAGGSLFVSRGSRPTRYYQPLARLALPLHKNLSWNSEWQYYGFGEQFYFFEAFRTHLFMTGLRLTR